MKSFILIATIVSTIVVGVSQLKVFADNPPTFRLYEGDIVIFGNPNLRNRPLKARVEMIRNRIWAGGTGEEFHSGLIVKVPVTIDGELRFILRLAEVHGVAGEGSNESWKKMTERE